MNILILTGGRLDEEFTLGLFEQREFSQVIVVDGALAFWDRVAKKSGNKLAFTHLVGDFDTISPDILGKYTNNPAITVHRFNPEKDYTDTDIAVKLAISLGKTGDQVFVCGALGSRVDHSLANLQMLMQIERAGMQGHIVDPHNHVRLIKDGARIRKEEQFGDFLSLIPVSPKLTGVSMSGFKYPLQNRDVDWGESLCVSNEITGEEGQISIREGYAFLIESRD